MLELAMVGPTSVILALERLRQEDAAFESELHNEALS